MEQRVPPPDRSPAARHAARLADHRTVAASLSRLSDRRLGRLVDRAVPAATGIGGGTAELDVDGVRVFVKRLPLTDTELRPGNVGSTANLFGLPPWYHYGAGSAGFGAWRELAVHTMTTGWVLGGDHAGFPLTHHWRVLPGAPSGPGAAAEFGGTEAAVAYWGGSPAVRARLTALDTSSWSLVLFLEHIPWTLAAWLAAHPAPADPGQQHAELERRLLGTTSFLRSRGLVHFDAHFRNILTDGRRLYFADFGLAAGSRFELAPDEALFHTRHLGYDRCAAASRLVRHLRGTGRDGAEPDRRTAAIIARHAPVAAVLDRFHRRLSTVSRSTPYPSAETERLLAAADGAPD